MIRTKLACGFLYTCSLIGTANAALVYTDSTTETFDLTSLNSSIDSNSIGLTVGGFDNSLGTLTSVKIIRSVEYEYGVALSGNGLCSVDSITDCNLSASIEALFGISSQYGLDESFDINTRCSTSNRGGLTYVECIAQQQRAAESSFTEHISARPEDLVHFHNDTTYGLSLSVLNSFEVFSPLRAVWDYSSWVTGSYVVRVDYTYTADDLPPNPTVPEPSEIVLMGLGILGFVATRRRKLQA